MTLAQIRAIWRARNARYAQRRYAGIPQPLTAAEETAVRDWRGNEVDSLVRANDRRAARAVLDDWHPPMVARS